MHTTVARDSVIASALDDFLIIRFVLRHDELGAEVAPHAVEPRLGEARADRIRQQRMAASAMPSMSSGGAKNPTRRPPPPRAARPRATPPPARRTPSLRARPGRNSPAPTAAETDRTPRAAAPPDPARRAPRRRTRGLFVHHPHRLVQLGTFADEYQLRPHLLRTRSKISTTASTRLTGLKFER